MNAGPKAAILAMMMMLSSGCLGAVEDIVDIEDEVVDSVLDWLNSEYPHLDLPERERTSPLLENYDQCELLLTDLQESIYNEMLVSLDQQSYWHWAGPVWRGGPEPEAFDDVAMMDGAPEAAADESGANTGVATDSDSGREGEFSGTNNQEEGVDEADFLKTDGYHIYMLNGNLLVIMGVPEFGELTLESNISIQGYPMQMMLEGERLVIASSIYYWNLPHDDPLRALMSEEVTVSYPGQEEYSYTYTRVQNLVKYTVVDITDRSAPEVERELYIEGNYHTARLVDGTMRSVTHLWTHIDGLRTWVYLPEAYWEAETDDERMEIWNQSMEETIAANQAIIDDLTLDDFAPHLYEVGEDGLFQHPISSGDCSEYSASADSAGRGFSTIMTIELLGDESQMELDHITSSWAHVYASQDVMVLAEPANDWWWFWRNFGWDDATNIHVFDISDPSETTYVASGRVSGTVQDQFSISEHNGVIRVATTEDAWGRWWLETDEWTGPNNNVFTLAASECMIPEGCDDESSEMVQIGHVGDIAPGERIWSARFVGERAYLVTFQNIDPLWVIDLTNPTNPVILGELEVPGVSTYIHPVDSNTLLTIGIGPGPDGLGLDWSVTQVSLFDVSDPTNPTLADSLQLSPSYEDEDCDEWGCGWSWSYSEATYEHKAFTYWAPEQLLAVPLSTYRYTYDEIEIDGRTYTYSGYEFVSTLELIDVDAENGTLSTHGMVNHSEFYNEDGLSGWWSGSTSIRRSIFMGDYIYAFSAAGASVHRTDDLTSMVELEIPGYDEPETYYYESEGEVESEDSMDSDKEEGESATVEG
ncbi:MAG: beta-propeller domain-containing protein [Candidatus Thermoplasmatota archaeon]|nr:beta-propeller domain-containing protein [Candidatus Thermoplasmatota archaeon]